MDILSAAATIGLDASSDPVGTIDEAAVIELLGQYAEEHPGAAERCAVAIVQVRTARSAGAERIAADSVFAARGHEVQLRYRGEMLDLLMDLAIDLALDDDGAEQPVG